MSVTLKGFFRCGCGKLHCYGGVWFKSKCPKCGDDLKKHMGNVHIKRKG